jgi:hypothetical protein
MLARGDQAMAELTLEAERYHGYWDAHGIQRPDPQGASLAQYRLSLAAGWRPAAHWQLTGSLPFVWNANVYSGISSHTRGVGDAALNLWYELLDERTAWRLRELSDLIPSVSAGLGLTLPTGISPYDRVTSSFDVTGRGFYRIDGNLLVEKGYRSFGAALALSYGVHPGRAINQEYGSYVEPYRKRLGDRAALAATLSYRHFVGTGGDSLSTALGFTWLREADGARAGAAIPTGIERRAVSGAVTYASTDSDWALRLSWSHALRRDGWGRDFPTTDIFSLGVRHALR